MSHRNLSTSNRWVIPAPRKAVFKAWTDSEMLTAWMNADPQWKVRAESDPRLGGKIRAEVTGPDGGVHLTTGEYLEFEPNVRCAVTNISQHPGQAAGPETLVTFEFKDSDGGQTEVTITHSRLASEEEVEQYRAAWNDLMQSFSAYISRDL